MESRDFFDKLTACSMAAMDEAEEQMRIAENAYNTVVNDKYGPYYDGNKRVSKVALELVREHCLRTIEGAKLTLVLIAGRIKTLHTLLAAP